MAIILVTLLLCLILSVPVSFSLIIASAAYILANGLPLMALAKQLVVSMDSYTLLAIPAFILAGQIMNMATVTERIFNFGRALVGHIPGGLAHANVVASIIFSGMSGSAIADTGGLGTVEIEGMVKEGYGPEFSAAVTGASAIIGPIIPPSIVALIYAASAEVSVGALFMAGVIPGLLMGLFLMVLIYFLAKTRNYPKSDIITFKGFVTITRKAFLPLMAPVIILGGITLGIFTPTEASVIAVAYGLLLGLIYKAVTVKNLYEGFLSVTVEMGRTGLLIASAVAFSWVLTHARIPLQAADLLLSVSENPLVVLLVINLFLFVVGCFMDPSAAILVLTPIFIPVITKLGIDPIHFGVVMILNLMIGLLTPPVGMCLYVVSNIAKARLEDVMKEMMPFFIPLVLALAIITIFPDVVLFLPRLVLGH
ncbi:ABC transporter permease [candidate division KSB3 bacterium]|uniref:ABC transporter permease n=1 Tax=candidate division KSB3 bacterium TaxID=2044937 RepID=A0A2G6KED8_9BACT|nr:MAG: ABC transporter permease [candidate division KSB3 bacterium]